jgi:hypothetical protein
VSASASPVATISRFLSPSNALTGSWASRTLSGVDVSDSSRGSVMLPRHGYVGTSMAYSQSLSQPSHSWRPGSSTPSANVVAQ